jgi:hypothetical protein
MVSVTRCLSVHDRVVTTHPLREVILKAIKINWTDDEDKIMGDLEEMKKSALMTEGPYLLDFASANINLAAFKIHKVIDHIQVSVV